MKTLFIARFVCVSAIALTQYNAPLLAAATDQLSLPVEVVKTADEEWEAVRDATKQRISVSPLESRAPADLARAREQVAARLVAKADELAGFRQRHPAHAQAGEAKRLEALTLVHAWQLGDETAAARRAALVAEIRQDTRLTAAQRAAVVVRAEHIAVAKRRDLSSAQRLVAYEEVVRRLTGEFPELPNGYESLLQIAKNSSDEKAQALAREVLQMPSAPRSIQTEAQRLLDRYALLGKSLSELAQPILAAGNPIERAQGRLTIVYTWTTFSIASVARAKLLAVDAPPDAVLIGVNLDLEDPAPAQEMAITEGLPGEQIFDRLGRHGNFAQQLQLVEPGLVYLADSKGIVRSVSAQRNFAEALANLTDR